ncbi:MAG: hypothetical protein WC875_02620 [Candidatus Absconditabacterales bacterium]|jgi:hypothetical protein
MFKKHGLIIICCLSLLVIAGCGKIGITKKPTTTTTTTTVSSNLQKCQALCDKQAVMYKDVATNYKTSCYSNCQEIEALNQRGKQ